MATEASDFIKLEDGWARIKEVAIDALLAQLRGGFAAGGRPFDNREYMNVYTQCYNMCTQRDPYNHSEQLYQRHGSTMQDYLASQVVPALQEKQGAYLLQELASRWKAHQVMNKWMKMFFIYLDRYYIKHNQFDCLSDVGIKAFKTTVYNHFKDDIARAVNQLIHQERAGEEVDHALLKSCVAIYEKMGMGTLDCYTEDFEDAMLRETEDYYARQAAAWITTDDSPTFLLKVEQAIAKEEKRINDYLIGSSTRSKLQTVCYRALISAHQTAVLESENSGAAALLRNNKRDALQRMFKLYNLIDNGLEPMASIVKTHFAQRGFDLIEERKRLIENGDRKDSASDSKLIKAFMELHDSCQSFVRDQFAEHQLFQKALNESFQEFVNADTGKHSISEFLAHYCDSLLKKGGERLNEEEVEQSLTRAVVLFNYIQDKDVFNDVYQGLLAKRLLQGRSASDDAEKSMIGKLKVKCGAAFTGKLEGMLNDLTTGAEHEQQFQDFVAEEKTDTGNVAFTVRVLTTGFWPTNPKITVALPESMSKCIDLFSDYYGKRLGNRKLDWAYSLGNATVSMTVKSKKYQLSVTTLQAACIAVIQQLTGGSSSHQISFGEIKEALGVEESVMKKLLHSLSCGKAKILSKTPKSNKIRGSDKFSPNGQFRSRSTKIRIPMASLTPTHNTERVQHERTNGIDAAIVRIMKTRTTMEHQNLLAEVMKQLQFFRPTAKLIKRRIESLIDREYLERDEENSRQYRYLA